MKRKTLKTTVEEVCEYGYICCDAPLLIRIMEYVREDVRSDTELHVIAERMIEESNECEVLTMKDYYKLVNDTVLQQPMPVEEPEE